MSRNTFEERPIYVGRTSRWSLGIDSLILTMIISALIFFIYVPTLVLSFVAPELLEKFMSNSPDIFLIIFVVFSAFFMIGIFMLDFLFVLGARDTAVSITAFILMLLLIVIFGVMGVLTVLTYDAAKYILIHDPAHAISTLQIIAGIIIGYVIIAFVLSYARALRIISTALDLGRRGTPNNARNLTTDMPNHAAIAYVNFKVYKDQIVVTDFTGWREWVYLVAGIYHIRVRQTWFGKHFNYGTVILRSIGTAGEIRFPGIKKPHEFKAFLQNQIKTGTVNLGGIIPPDMNRVPR